MSFLKHIDMNAYRTTMSNPRRDLVMMARTAEGAERYEDMCKFMRELVLWTDTQADKPDLTIEERNLLSVAYKNVIGARRASWRTLNVDEFKDEELLVMYRKQVESELADICRDVLELLENVLVKNSTKPSEARVFYLKMTGDYYRYLAEFMPSEGYDQKAANNYSAAFDIAKTELTPTHPIRLGLALNFSVCFYEILKDKKAACELAKSAFDEAISKLDQLDEASYKDSTLIMQLLRDNLTLWTTADEGDNAVQVEEVEDEE